MPELAQINQCPPHMVKVYSLLGYSLLPKALS